MFAMCCCADGHESKEIVKVGSSFAPPQQLDETSAAATREQACEEGSEKRGGDLPKEGSAEPAERLSGFAGTKEFTIQVRKDGDTTHSGKVGLDVARCGAILRIKRVTEGVIMDWNTTHPDGQVQAMDNIVEVNGQRGSADLLLRTIGKDTVLNLIIERPPGGEHEGRAG